MTTSFSTFNALLIFDGKKIYSLISYIFFLKFRVFQKIFWTIEVHFGKSFVILSLLNEQKKLYFELLSTRRLKNVPTYSTT